MRLRGGPSTPNTQRFLEWYNALKSPIRRSQSIRRLPIDKRTIGSLWRELHNCKTEEEWNSLLVQPDLDSDLHQEIVRYGEFAEACYDNFDLTLPSSYNGRCKYPKTEFLAKAGLGESGYQVTRYLYGVSGDPMGLLERESTWMGFVAVSTSPKLITKLGRRDILVSWRGTKLPMEWIANIRDILVPLPVPHVDESMDGNDGDGTQKEDGALMVPKNNNKNNKNVKVEDGFLSIYMSRMEDETGGFNRNSSAREQLLSEVGRLLSEYLEKGETIGITVTGHSMGGTLALLAAYDLGRLQQQYSSSLMVTVITFACPRLGNLGFKKEIERLGVKAIRVVNENDIVPRLPGVILNEQLGMSRLLNWLPWTYFHVGVTIRVDNRVSPFLDKYKTFDLSCTHNMEVYLHLLDAYPTSSGNQEQEGNNHVSTFQWRGRDPALVNKRCDMLVQRLGIPPYWWQDRNKGLSQNAKGRWVLPSWTNNEEEEEEDKEADNRISDALNHFENDQARIPHGRGHWFPSPIFGVPWSFILAFTLWWTKLFIISLLPKRNHSL